jgi:hypothetical protein
MSETNPTNNFDIVPTALVVEAMRDNGYKNAAYAIAELIDNAIQAGATLVQLLCGERQTHVQERTRRRVERIAVLDNGCGMDARTLRIALQFGNGTRLSPDKHDGIGRFGMGLPASSISQCQRVEVWSWQDGIENALYSYLDISEIKSGAMRDVPEPVRKPLPERWLQVGTGYGESGTLVVWSQIDRCIWKSGQTIIDNSELIIGRMYRNFLDGGKARIRMATFDIESPRTSLKEKDALPNDPGYLMAKTSCPIPFANVPMFKPLGESSSFRRTFQIEHRGKNHPVTVTFSYAKEEARQNPNAGNQDHGRHAGRNVGVSIVRAGRELDMDQGFVIQYDPRERWWGVEVAFPPALDDVFGVTNNKQAARNFADVARMDIDALTNGGQTITQVKDEMREDNDPRGALLDVAQAIRSNLSSLRDLIKQQSINTRSSQKRHEETKAERTATLHTRERQEEGKYGRSDKAEALPVAERKEAIATFLKEEGYAPQAADDIAARTVDDGLKYRFAQAALDSPAFFSVRPEGGAIIITLNTNHPAYDKLMDVLERDTQGNSNDELTSRLGRARDGLKLLLSAWARYEDEQPDGRPRTVAQDARSDWGRIARQFLEGED